MKPILVGLLIGGLASGWIFLVFPLDDRDASALSASSELITEVPSLSECLRQHSPEEKMSREFLADILNHAGGLRPGSWALANPVPLRVLGTRFANLPDGRYRMFLGHEYPDLIIVSITIQNAQLIGLELRTCYQ
ncbi:MAG: hypothetical protein KME20_01210 [Kaiparowitsia implicata GSE-PSE-MK54-09C]|nr:hypothetical protein [Kaiparowitsia implicata GSE-PSE-MK54-09C]